MRFKYLSLVIVVFISSCRGNNPKDIEVLHWWTSDGEANSMELLKSSMRKKGHIWKDFPVAGGGGSSAMTVLKSRVFSGNPPLAVQVKGQSIQRWGEQNVLATLNEDGKQNALWNKLPSSILSMHKYKNSYVAVPVNIHRNNWLWINQKVFMKLRLLPPKTWEEFERCAQKLKSHGFIPVAHGGQAWQDNTVFELLLLATGGANFYKQALLTLEPNALQSKTMVKVFERFRRFKSYIDANYSGRDWNLATSMVIRGEAGMQIMGDWAKAEFFAAKQIATKDFIVVPFPDTQGSFVFTTDSFIFFKQVNPLKKKAINDFVDSILSESFQIDFNVNKGSIPVDTTLNMKKFDIYAKQSLIDFKRTTKLPSMAHGMAIESGIQGAIEDSVTNFFNTDDISPQDGVKDLFQAIMKAKKMKK